MDKVIQIRVVKSSKEMMQFIKFPWQIYSDDPHWIPHLIMERKKFFNKNKNPFFKNNPTEFYLAYHNGKIVGRIAAIINHAHNEFHKDKTGFFGFLEAVNDKVVFEALLNTAKIWLKEHDCDNIVGPVNPSTNDEAGFLLEGFDSPPYFMMTHTPPYYIEIMENLGYLKAKDLFAYLVDQESANRNQKFQRISALIKKKYPIKIRPINLKNFKEELELVREIYNDAWAPNWGFVPMSREEFDFVANDFKQIIDPRTVFIGEYKGEAVGFLLALPNYNVVFQKILNGKLFPWGIFKFLYYKRKINSLRVVTLGIKQKYQPLGLGALFYHEIVKRGPECGYYSAEMSWVLEDNELMIKAAGLVGGTIHKKYRIYQLPLY